MVGAALAASGLVVSMGLSCMLPRSGGSKVYLESKYRRPRFLGSTIVVIQAVVLSFTASNVIVFGEFKLVALNIELTAVAQRMLAVGLMTVITIVYECLLKTGIWIPECALMGQDWTDDARDHHRRGGPILAREVGTRNCRQ
ncbi:MAG: hypothetical protein M1835_001821, partial [Candelina submexicana]